MKDTISRLKVWTQLSRNCDSFVTVTAAIITGQRVDIHVQYSNPPPTTETTTFKNTTAGNTKAYNNFGVGGTMDAVTNKWKY